MNSSITQAALVYLPAEQRVALAAGIELAENTTGAALFADISGFTPLTEALTRALGLRRGAEELPIYLDRVYAGLIQQVNYFGGSVIGFAGDAITCWFDDQPVGFDGAAVTPGVIRAGCCAQALQAAMRAFAAIPVPGQEPVSLSVKVAVAAGPVRRFIVGDPSIQRIELIAGSTVMRMAAGEHQANKGDIIFDEPAALAHGAGISISEWRVEGHERFAVVVGLDGPPGELPWPEPNFDALDAEKVKTWVLPPIYARLSAGLGEFLTELRPATALFLKFGGIDYDNDPAAGQKLDAYIRWAQKILNKYEAVCTHPTIGDKGSFLCTSFGAPIAHDDDSRRAAAAALELMHPPDELAYIAPVQIGIAQGTVRTGSYGGATRKTYDILGDQVNLAARLMTRAQPGEILTSERVQRQIESDFSLQTLEPIMVKGKSQPVTIARLEGRQAQSTGSAQALLLQAGTLYGRAEELARLEVVITAALAGQAQVVRLQGPAGVGKSRLTAEFVQCALQRGLRCLVGVGQSTQKDTPFLAWQSALRGLLAFSAEHSNPAAFLENALTELSPEWGVRAPLLGALLGVSLPDTPTTAALEPKLRFEATLTLAVDLLRKAAAAQPLLLLIDDIHWLDESSRELVLAAARGVNDLPFILLLVQRPAEGLLAELTELPGYTPINLGVLSQSAIERIVAARLGGPSTPLVTAVIQSQAQGNPYFAEQMVMTMKETGSLVEAEGRWSFPEKVINALRDANSVQKNLDTSEWEIIPGVHIPTDAIGVPDSVQGAMLARIDRLPEPDKLTLRAASVLGRAFALPILERSHPVFPGSEALQSQFAQFISRGFVVAEESDASKYAFSNNALQEVLYSSLPTAVQEDVHCRAGAALEQIAPEGLPALAYHYARAGVLARPKALHYLDLAAAHAQKNYANATALNYYRQALALEERWQWRKGQAEVLHLLGVRDEEKTAIQALENLPGAPKNEALRLWYSLFQEIADYPAAQQSAEALLADSRASGNRLQQADSLWQLGLVARKQGDNQQALEYYRQAETCYTEDSLTGFEALRARARLFNSLGAIYMRTGQYEQATKQLELGLGLAQQSSLRSLEADMLIGLGLTAINRRKLEQATHYFTAALGVSKSIGDRAGEARAIGNLAIVSKDMGQFSASIGYSEAALRLLQATGDRWNEINILNELGVVYQELGQYLKSEWSLERARQLSQAIGDEGGIVYILVNQSIVTRNMGHLEHTKDLLKEGLSLARKFEDQFMESVYLSQQALLEQILGDFNSAAEHAIQARRMRMEMDLEVMTTDNLAVLAAASLELGKPEQALDFACQALELLERSGGEGPENPAQDYWLSHQVFKALRLDAEARKCLENALHLICQRAAHIQEADWRRSYLENVPVCRNILVAASAAGLALPVIE